MREVDRSNRIEWWRLWKGRERGRVGLVWGFGGGVWNGGGMDGSWIGERMWAEESLALFFFFFFFPFLPEAGKEKRRRTHLRNNGSKNSNDSNGELIEKTFTPPGRIWRTRERGRGEKGRGRGRENEREREVKDKEDRKERSFIRSSFAPTTHEDRCCLRTTRQDRQPPLHLCI